MNLYLTNADISLLESNGNSPQLIPSNSIGGYVSSTPAPSGAIGELFDTISKLTLEAGCVETIALCLKNDLRNFGEVRIKLLTSDLNLAKYKIAAVPIDVENWYMERMSDRYQSPQQGEFVNADVYKAFVDVEILAYGSLNEEFSIIPFDMMGVIKESSFDGVFNAVKKAFVSSSVTGYVVKRLNEKKFRIEGSTDKIEDFQCELITTGSLQLSFSKNFGNEVNNYAVLKQTFDKGDGIGIWIQRVVESAEPTDDSKMIIDYENKTVVETVEEVELIIDFDEIIP